MGAFDGGTARPRRDGDTGKHVGLTRGTGLGDFLYSLLWSRRTGLGDLF